MLDSFKVRNDCNIALAEWQLGETDQPKQTNDSDMAERFYNQCIEIASKDTCDFVFQKKIIWIISQ
jgi:hypothetical protein